MSEIALDGRAVSEIAAMAKATIANGSQSFAAAARLFDPRTREGAMMLYAWCRHLDDVVDDQHLGFRRELVQFDARRHDKAGVPAAEARIAELEAQTRRAFAGDSVAHPSFLALKVVAERHELPLRLALDHLDGFRMDAEGRRYGTIEDTLDYCHHVAGVVGVMMSMVMGVRDEAVLVRAADLGLAFQLTNIARDLVPDAEVGRVYVPADWLAEAGLEPVGIARAENRGKVAILAARLVALAEPYYASARIGMDALPRRSAWAVATALGVYREIGLRVVRLGAGAWDRRVSTSRADKLWHVARAALLAGGPRGSRVEARSPELWSHAAVLPQAGIS